MKLLYSPRARQDIADLGRYIRERSPSAAVAVREAIRASLGVLVRYPQAGRIIGRAGLRRLAVPRLPYLVFYVVDEPANVVRIVTIRHAAQHNEI